MAKFPKETEVIFLRVDQKKSRKYYTTTFKGKMDK